MSPLFRTALIVIALVSMQYVFRRIRKAKMQVEDSVFWILFSFLFILLSVFPGIAMFFSGILGIQSPANFVYLCVFFILIMKLFTLSLKVSKLEDDLASLAQKYAIHEQTSERTLDRPAKKTA